MSKSKDYEQLTESCYVFLKKELPKLEPDEKILKSIFNRITIFNLKNLHTPISAESELLITELLINNKNITSIIIQNASLNYSRYRSQPEIQRNVVFDILVNMLKKGPRALDLLHLEDLENGEIPDPFQEFWTNKQRVLRPYWDDLRPPVISHEKITCNYSAYSHPGGYSCIYSAFLEKTPVAMKIVINTKENFYKEARIMFSLQNMSTDNLFVRLRGVVLDSHAIVMEYTSLGDLSNFQKKYNLHRGFTWALRYRIALNIAKGIAFLHSKGILHLDIKRSNILVFIDKGVLYAKLADFDQTQSLDDLLENKEYGTPAWNERRYNKGVARTSKATEIFSYGLILWCLAQNKAVTDIGMGWFTKEIPDSCPEKFKQLYLKCHVEGSKRITIEEIAAELEELVSKNPLCPESLEFLKQLQKDSEVKWNPNDVDKNNKWGKLYEKPSRVNTQKELLGIIKTVPIVLLRFINIGIRYDHVILAVIENKSTQSLMIDGGLYPVPDQGDKDLLQIQKSLADLAKNPPLQDISIKNARPERLFFSHYEYTLRFNEKLNAQQSKIQAIILDGRKKMIIGLLSIANLPIVISKLIFSYYFDDGVDKAISSKRKRSSGSSLFIVQKKKKGLSHKAPQLKSFNLTRIAAQSANAQPVDSCAGGAPTSGGGKYEQYMR